MSIQWIAVDWGTTNLSAFAVGADAQILDRIRSNKGMSSLKPDEFEPTLLAAIEPWLSPDHKMHIVACGMVGAQQGWKEAPYTATPCRPITSETTLALGTKDPRISVQIVPGVCQFTPEDVMRGEETQIAGYLARHPDFDGFFCLPGTHTKWAEVEGGEIKRFTTFMTGEMFGLLSKTSVLRFCVDTHEWFEDAFVKAFEEMSANSTGLTSKLFSLRSQALLNKTPASVLKSRLSGYLIGAELADICKNWPRRDVVIIGDDANARLYQTGLEICGYSSTVFEGPQAIVLGLEPIAMNSISTRGGT